MLDASKLKKLRQDQGLTATALAGAAGVARATISLWENGHIHEPNAPQLRAVADVLGVRPSDLLKE